MAIADGKLSRRSLLGLIGIGMVQSPSKWFKMEAKCTPEPEISPLIVWNRAGFNGVLFSLTEDGTFHAQGPNSFTLSDMQMDCGARDISVKTGGDRYRFWITPKNEVESIFAHAKRLHDGKCIHGPW